MLLLYIGLLVGFLVGFLLASLFRANPRDDKP